MWLLAGDDNDNAGSSTGAVFSLLDYLQEGNGNSHNTDQIMSGNPVTPAIITCQLAIFASEQVSRTVVCGGRTKFVNLQIRQKST